MPNKIGPDLKRSSDLGAIPGGDDRGVKTSFVVVMEVLGLQSFVAAKGFNVEPNKIGPLSNKPALCHNGPLVADIIGVKMNLVGLSLD